MKSQWRQCSEKYYPYTSSADDRFDYPQTGPGTNHLHVTHPSVVRPPYRPPSQPPQETIIEHHPQSNNHFLDPPKPGGFGQGRHWPISYLHKEPPPNDTSSFYKSEYVKSPQARNSDSKYAAIANLIDVIKTDEVKNLNYQVSNDSDKTDDVLYVKIPLPSNYTGNKSEKITEDIDRLEAVDLIYADAKDRNNEVSRSGKFIGTSSGFKNSTSEGKSRLYVRSYITKTNRTSNSQSSKSFKTNIESSHTS